MIQGNFLSQLIFALVIFIITLVVERICVRALRRFLNSSDKLSNNSIYVNITRVVIWLFAISIILDTCFNVNMSAVIAALGIGGIAISLGFQDTISNLIGGLQVSAMHIIRPGDHISIGQDEGVVEDITWRHTIIKNRFGETIVVPNSIINKDTLSILPPRNCGTVYFSINEKAEDLDSIQARLIEAATEAIVSIVPLEKDPEVFFIEITEFGIKGKMVFYLTDHQKLNAAISACVKAIAPVTGIVESSH